MTFEIRPEGPSDREAALQVELAAFGSDEEAAIVVAVRDLEGSFALVAVDGDEVVGHVQMSRAWIGDRAVLSLGPIGVAPARQGHGIGSSLVRAALDRAAQRGEPVVMLLGSPAFYGRFGFRAGLGWGLANPFTGVDEGDFVIAEGDFQIAIVGDHAPALTGTVRWHPAFGAAG